MAIRFYITPKVTVTNGGVSNSRPAHMSELGIKPWSGIDYGKEPLYLIQADVTPAQHTSLTGFSDVFAFPASLTATVGNTATVNAAKTKLEALKLPADWLTTSTTVGEALKTLARFMLLNQRVEGRTGKSLFDVSFTPDTTVASLTTNQRNALSGVLTSFGLDTAQVTGTTTLRQILKSAAGSMVLPKLDKRLT